MSWQPQNELEEAIVALQPNHDFIYGHLTDKIEEEKRIKNINVPGGFQGHSLRIMRQVAEMAGRKKEEVKIGDWDENNGVSAQQEITAMIRYFGMCSSKDVPLEPPIKSKESRKPSPTPKNKGTHDSKMVLLGDDDFQVVSTRMKNRMKLEEDINVSTCAPLKAEKEYTNYYRASKGRPEPEQPICSKVKTAAINPKGQIVENDFGTFKFYTPTEVYHMKKLNGNSTASAKESI